MSDSAVASAALATEVSETERSKRGASVEINRKVEKAAISFVTDHYELNGWTVTVGGS